MGAEPIQQGQGVHMSSTKRGYSEHYQEMNKHFTKASSTNSSTSIHERKE